MMGVQVRYLDEGKRLHLHHGPIDLIIEAKGHSTALAYQVAINRFECILDELVEELELLRKQCRNNSLFSYSTARRMQIATSLFLPIFVTPMAAVAGAVADEVLYAMKSVGGLDKIYVNNGGDIAFHIADGQSISAAIASGVPGHLHIRSQDKYRGIATSGWRGRSQSLGIADSVTVVAKDAAMADCAATLIANAVDLPNSAKIIRMAADEVFPDSDLGVKLVTVDVGKLTNSETSQALENGERLALEYYKKGYIGGAMLVLQGQSRQIGSNNIIQTKAGELEYA